MANRAGLKHGEIPLPAVLPPGVVVPGVVVPGGVVPGVVLPDVPLPFVNAPLLFVAGGETDVVAESSLPPPPPPQAFNAVSSSRPISFNECVLAFMKDSF